MMAEDSRILPWHGEKFTGRLLLHRRWAANDDNDHDHCAFCWEKFAAYEGCLQVGYCTEDEEDWICEICFNDFRERFGWRVKADA